MLNSCLLKPLQSSDHLAVREVYADAIESQGDAFYTKDQIQAWAALAWLPGILDRPLVEGKGWITVESGGVEAFAIRHPLDRLALLYCRGRSARRGYATALLDRVEEEALKEGLTSLVTEASFFSYPLLLRCGWVLKAREKIKIGEVSFERFRMIKMFY